MRVLTLANLLLCSATYGRLRTPQDQLHATTAQRVPLSPRLALPPRAIAGLAKRGLTPRAVRRSAPIVPSAILAPFPVPPRARSAHRASTRHAPVAQVARLARSTRILQKVQLPSNFAITPPRHLHRCPLQCLLRYLRRCRHRRLLLALPQCPLCCPPRCLR